MLLLLAAAPLDRLTVLRSSTCGGAHGTDMGGGKGRSMKPGICKREYEMEYENRNMGIGIWELECGNWKYKMKYKKCNGLSAI